MAFFNFFKKKKQVPGIPDRHGMNSKEDILKSFFEQMVQRSPSESFASGAVFDIARQQRGILEQIIRSNDASGLHKWFVNAYTLFCTNPQIVNFSPNMVNLNNNDVDVRQFNADTFNLPNGDMVALCFMPIQNYTFEARIIGIILSNKGDGYYYCMLSKDENAFSEVVRNKSINGIEKVGEINGRGFVLMNNFMNCIQKDFYNSKS